MTSFNTYIVPTYFSSWWYRESTCMCGRQCAELLSLSRDITIQPRFTTAIFWKKSWTIFVQSYSVMEKSIRYSHHFRTIWAQISLFSIYISSFWDQNKGTDHGLFEHLLEISPQRAEKSIHCRRTASECAWQMVKKPRNVIWLHKSKCIWKRSRNFSHEYNLNECLHTL